MARYRSYRGKSYRGKVILAVILAVVLSAGYGVYWVTEHITINADGTIRVNLPQFMSPDPLPPQEESSSPPLAIVVVSPSPQPPSETLAPTPTPTPTPPPLRAAFVPQEVLADIEKLTQLKADAEAAGLNTLVLDYKTDDGVVAAPEAMSAAREVLGDSFRYTARISVFLDNTMTRQRNSTTVKHVNGMNWLNSGGRWLNPYAEQSLEYCLSVISDAGALGFDEILLDHACFPWDGLLNRLTYGEYDDGRAHTDVMRSFYERAGALNLGAPLSVTALYDTVVGGEQTVAGQRMDDLRECFDKVYVVWPDPVATLNGALIPILTDAPSEALQDKLSGIASSYMLMRADGVYR